MIKNIYKDYKKIKIKDVSRYIKINNIFIHS